MEQAIRAAVAYAAAHGIRSAEPAVLKDGSNVLVHLRPAPVVARVAGTTGLVRHPVANWFAREVSLVDHLLGHGSPVVSPTPELPRGPVVHDGLTMSFWTFVPHDPAVSIKPVDFALSLASLHRALADYSGPLPTSGPLDDILLGLPLVGEHAPVLRAEHERLSALLPTGGQALHGDAHPGNVLATPAGLVWNDFEDTWRGPIEWDLAVLARTRLLDGEAALAAYPDPFDADLVELCREIRWLQVQVWMQASVRRNPARKIEVDAELTRWIAHHRR
ncbi:phosphotransferase [Kutzneria sp. CA-103260]|uniref:phosphotransferase n=1 Tax=Kutzneria sp. CA-103260 TaxID=2802641 RepID=UPI001BA49531|nr:phosphotransferase [Kutzneria sp. CA-103260]QUQ68512.1 aminoglycoside phosphotransferase [Kutzneria sp. CA-103260]